MNTLSLDELIAPNDPRFHIMRAHHAGNAKHAHRFFELVYVTEGYCIHTHNSLSALLVEGDVFILPPGTAHSYGGNRVTHIYNCLFEESFLGGETSALLRLPAIDPMPEGRANVPIEIHLPMNMRVGFRKTLDEMFETYERKLPGYEDRLRSMLLQLLDEYARAAERPQAGSGYAANVYRALGLIDEKYSDSSLRVCEVAKTLGVSADHLTRQFRAVTGVSACAYLRHYRFARAMEMLSQGSSVRDTAKASGFGSLSYFSREFNREFGITPTEYQRL